MFEKHLIQDRSIELSRKPLLEVKNLTVCFETEEDTVEVTDHVSFEILPGEIFGLVGESGCGKTVTALALLKLLPTPIAKITSGRVTLHGTNILTLPLEKIRHVRGKDISMLFQEPAAALNPLLNVKSQLMECFDYHAFDGNKERRVRDLLQRVGFPDPQRNAILGPHMRALFDATKANCGRI